MRYFLKRLNIKRKGAQGPKIPGREIERRVDGLFSLLGDLFGPDRLVLKAGKLDALEKMRSKNLEDRVIALCRIVYEDPTLNEAPELDALPGLLDEIQEALAEKMARRSIEEDIERRVALKMQERHDEFVRELKIQVLKEDGGPDNAATLKKYAELEKKEHTHLARSIAELLRPANVNEVVGQSRAIKALFAKIASPFPQHVILYGPPGVGKTTVARLALQHAAQLPFTPFPAEAPFVEVDGSTLRWDPREVSNPLLGSVHDPIYQGARRDLAESAVPEPKPGLVTEAHGGVLFIDEIGEMDSMLQNKLLKVLEDKRVRFESAYYDPSDDNIPKYIKKLFEDGAPADFILIGATTRDPSEVNPALRSRCAEVFFDPLGRPDIHRIVRNAAEKLQADLEDVVPDVIARYTSEGRRAVGILADAYGIALSRQEATLAQTNGRIADVANGAPKRNAAKVRIAARDIAEVASISRLTPQIQVAPSDEPEIGRMFGLGVSGFVGSVLEIEAIAFRAVQPGKGTIRFNETAGEMTRDSVFNAASVVRRITGENLSDWDIHVNVVGGGRIDGPSAGAAILLAIISALWERPVRQDVAITGEISIQGRVRPVGGIYEKIYGAVQADIKRIIIPKENADEAPQLLGVEVYPVATIEEVLDIVFPGGVARLPIRGHLPHTSQGLHYGAVSSYPRGVGT